MSEGGHFVPSDNLSSPLGIVVVRWHGGREKMGLDMSYQAIPATRNLIERARTDEVTKYREEHYRRYLSSRNSGEG